MKSRFAAVLACSCVGIALNNGCSFGDLDYLRAERDRSGGGAGSASGGVGGTAPSSGGTALGGSPGINSGGGVSTSGGASGGSEPTAGEGGASSGQAGAAEVENGGSAGGKEGGTGGEVSPSGGGGDGGSAGAEGGALATGGGPPSNTVTYGVDGQSCSGGLECPGGGSCCHRILVPAGSFAQGTSSDANALADEKPAHTATLKAFELDEFEVTVGRLRPFVEVYDGTLPDVGAGAYLAVAGSGWQAGFVAEMPDSRAALEAQLNCDVGNYQTWTTQAGARDGFPLNCVSWYVALAFCIWDGGRLPTEAEWERASAGGDEERLYPWGSQAPDFSVHAVANCRGDGVAGCAPSDLLAVGSRPGGKGKWGHEDLAGSLWEWTLDHYDATYYQSVGTCSDCVNLGALTPRVIRGGNFTNVAQSLRGTGRASKAASVADPYAGFRCARSP
jgi:sulfatase modifying factor 1